MATKIIAPGGVRPTCNSAKAATAATASKADTAAAPVENERLTPTSQAAPTAANIARAFEDAATILEAASQTYETHQYSGESERLLRFAAGVASAAAAHPSSPADGQQVGFDLATLVKAALRVTGDTCSIERRALITSVEVLLIWMTGEDDVLHDKSPHATAASEFTTEQLRVVLETVAGRTRTLQQVLMMLQSTCIADEYHRAVCMDAAEAMATAIGAMADGATGGGVIGDADFWHYGSSFANAGKAVQA